MTHISDLLKKETPTLSYEFFPPKTEAGLGQLRKTLETLAATSPDFVSVTYGAMGSTRETTRDLVAEICRSSDFPAMAHLTCVGHTKTDISELLDFYAANGVENILALGGDLPEDYSGDPGDFSYASDLIEHIKTHRHNFCVGVAAHPEVHPRSESRKTDRGHLAAKLQVADFAITQFSFKESHYEGLLDDLHSLGVHKPVLAGIIPITNTKSIRRFSDLNKVAVPEDFFAKLEAEPNENIRIEMAVEQASALAASALAAGASGIHIYTLNHSTAPAAIITKPY